jgi:hypothetical protein
MIRQNIAVNCPVELDSQTKQDIKFNIITIIINDKYWALGLNLLQFKDGKSGRRVKIELTLTDDPCTQVVSLNTQIKWLEERPA